MQKSLRQRSGWLTPRRMRLGLVLKKMLKSDLSGRKRRKTDERQRQAQKEWLSFLRCLPLIVPC
jgi:hypothetical protein